nr:hypothetical protein [Tanacetum cinerariifolium]
MGIEDYAKWVWGHSTWVCWGKGVDTVLVLWGCTRRAVRKRVILAGKGVRYCLMDDDGLNIRNWGYYEPPSFKEHLGLQLMSPIVDHRDTKPFLSPREHPIMVNPNGVMPYHHNHSRNSVINESPLPLQYMRDGWIQRERHHHMLSGNNNYPLIHDSSGSQSMHMMHQLDSSNNHGMMMEDSAASGGGDSGSGGSGSGVQLKRRSELAVANPKQPRAKKPRKVSSVPKENGNPSGRSKTVKRSMDVVINGIDMDISGIPIPVCSCTGVQQQCYRWGCGGWQSACCTTTISMYPLPMSTKRRGARIAGRKMSQGAFKKVLEKLASESYNFANAIDLRLHWAKHGSQSMHMMHQLDSSNNHGMMMEDSAASGGGDSGSGGSGSGVQLKRRSESAVANPKQPRAKKPRKVSSVPKENGNPSGRSKTVKRSMDVVINGIDMDISGIPIPVCSCTGVQQQCYRWGCGGWQSACCTTTISMYPLPMSTKRRGARIAGRKMSQGAFKKVLEKLASESYNFANAIDLRLHWAKHGTNKFVTIR